jgi:RND family efflux transporter MFP subunit
VSDRTLQAWTTIVAVAVVLGWFGGAAADEPRRLQVRWTVVEDRKAVYATVETRDVVAARARIGGTVAALTVDEGTAVTAGQRLAVVEDAKLALNREAVEERLKSLESQQRLAETTLQRSRQLFAGGNLPKARLDEAETNLTVLGREIAALTAERQVIEERQGEGAVLAPVAGRVIRVPVTTGTVILPGETVADIAARGFILRLQLPERHARFLGVGDAVVVGAPDQAGPAAAAGSAPTIGRVSQVYPELQQGRVVADVEVPDLGDFFIGERVRVYVATGRRRTLVVPAEFLSQRYGLTFVTLAAGRDVVVQPGQTVGDGIEILSGLEEGDVLVRPRPTP